MQGKMAKEDPGRVVDGIPVFALNQNALIKQPVPPKMIVLTRCSGEVWNVEVRTPYLLGCQHFTRVHAYRNGALVYEQFVRMTRLDISNKEKDRLFARFRLERTIRKAARLLKIM